jgi:hypothetical protein
MRAAVLLVLGLFVAGWGSRVPPLPRAAVAGNPFAEQSEEQKAAGAANPFMRPGGVGALMAKKSRERQKEAALAAKSKKPRVVTTSEAPVATDSAATEQEAVTSGAAETSTPAVELGTVPKGPPPLPLPDATTGEASTDGETTETSFSSDEAVTTAAPFNKDEIVALERKEEAKELAKMQQLSAQKAACETEDCRAEVRAKQVALEKKSEDREAVVASIGAPIVTEAPVMLAATTCSLPITQKIISSLLPEMKSNAEKVSHVFVSWESKLTKRKWMFYVRVWLLANLFYRQLRIQSIRSCNRRTFSAQSRTCLQQLTTW